MDPINPFLILFICGQKIGYSRYCSLADKMDRVYEKVFVLYFSDKAKQQKNYSQHYQYMYQTACLPNK
jgi:hypothetical protein